MGWLSSLFGAKKMSDWEIVKQIGENETDRLRAAMERRPRVSQETIVACSKRFNSLEEIGVLYPQMRRDDFCEAELLALKSGTLAEDQFNLVMYTREWVLSGGDKRTIFPVWLQGEGRQRFTVELNRQWLASGHRTMTFTEWYANRRRQLSWPVSDNYLGR
jgi:hypothetical protein